MTRTMNKQWKMVTLRFGRKLWFLLMTVSLGLENFSYKKQNRYFHHSRALYLIDIRIKMYPALHLP